MPSLRHRLTARPFQVLLSPIVSLVSAATTAVTVILAARSGQFADIAAFSAGLSAASLTSAVIGGGTSLAYANGDDDTRAAVKRIRMTIIAPLLVTSGIAAALYYSMSSSLTPIAVGLGGLTAAFLNLSELEGSNLQREFRLPVWAVATMGNRIAIPVLVFAGLSYSLATTIGALGLVGCLLGANGRHAAPPVTLIRDSLVALSTRTSHDSRS